MPRVFVIGGANVDIKGRSAAALVAGTSNPGTVMVSPGGVARNIAQNLAQLGIDVGLIAAVGEDGNGAWLAAESERAGIDCTRLIRTPLATGSYLAIVDDRGELVAAVNDMRATALLTAGHIALYADEFSRADFLVADCNLGAGALGWLETFARTHGVRLLVEPVSVPKAATLMQLASLAGILAITPNRQQVRAMTGLNDDCQAIAALHARGIANVVVHCGRDGAMVSDGRAAPRKVSAQASGGIADVTGAGDAAVAGLVFGIIEGLPLAEAARLGQKAAALKLGSHLSVAPQINRDRLLES